MPISASAQISIPLDIAKVDVITTKHTRDGKFVITVESQEETTRCGVCQQPKKSMVRKVARPLPDIGVGLFAF